MEAGNAAQNCQRVKTGQGSVKAFNPGRALNQGLRQGEQRPATSVTDLSFLFHGLSWAEGQSLETGPMSRVP